MFMHDHYDRMIKSNILLNQRFTCIAVLVFELYSVQNK